MATVEDYAVLSAYVYGGAGRPPLPSGWAPVLKVDGAVLEHSGESGYYGAVFQHRVTGEVAVISRGTELTDVGDLRADWTLKNGGVPSGQLDDARSLLNSAL